MAADGLTITPITWSGDMICMKIQLHGCAYGEEKMKVYRPKNAISLLIISTCEKAFIRVGAEKINACPQRTKFLIGQLWLQSNI